MKRFVIVLCLLCVLTSCDVTSDIAENARLQWMGVKEATRNDPPRQVPRGAKPEIIAKGVHITFEGQPLRLGDDFEKWAKVLGPSYRPMTPNNKYETLFIWDELGILVQLDRKKKKKIESFNIELNFKQIYEDWNPDAKDYRPGIGGVPARFFSGYLEVNGVAIDAQSTIREVNRRANGKLSIECMRGLNICSDHLRPADAPSIDFEVDSRKESSIIYGVSFSIWGRPE